MDSEDDFDSSQVSENEFMEDTSDIDFDNGREELH
jgi:hypothetical protein